jgi:photosystem II stability/assembly factor-like uncharacterized protein
LLLPAVSAGTVLPQELLWSSQGPEPNTHGQVEEIEGGEVTGAVNTVAAHPVEPGIVYIGTANGGIWKTENANAKDWKPRWVHQTDDQESLSIGALEFDPLDNSHQTLVAGIGRFSSLANAGGLLTGLLRTSNGGGRWDVLDGAGALRGLNVSGVAPRGPIIAISVNCGSDPSNCDANAGKVGVWRTQDGGRSWNRISGRPGSGLPDGDSPGLAADRELQERLYAAAGGAGLYRSDDVGASWRKVSQAPMDLLLDAADNVKMSAGPRNSLFVAIDVGGHLAGVFHTTDGGDTWAEMELPALSEGGIHPGGQGRIHLSLAADPLDGNIVYIGGDRQPGNFGPPIIPNSIGATDYSGRLFRGDISKPSGSQWVHLTHSSKLGAPGGGTLHGSAPHADSRGMALVHGVLLEVDDGGIYQRTDPRTNSGDWFSLNGNLAVTEFHAVAWDDNCHLVIGGAQDTGTPEQRRRWDRRWQSVSKGDGGVVAVDTVTTPGLSVRYSSFFDLGGLRRQVFDCKPKPRREDPVGLMVLDGGPPPDPQFYTPLKLNTVVPSRLILGANNGVYESYDRGDTLLMIGPGIKVNGSDPRTSLIQALQGPNAIAYGAKGNTDVLYLGSGPQVLVRMAANPSPLTASRTYSGGTVLGIAIDRKDARTAFVVSPRRVSRTSDAGLTWSDLTGDLPSLVHGDLLSIVYQSETGEGTIFVGTSSGVFMARADAPSHWQRLGRGLANAAVYHLEYSDADGMLLAGTLGRGAWTLKLPGIVRTVAAAGGRQESRAVLSFADAGEGPGNQAKPAPQAASTESAALQDASGRSAFQLAPGIIVDPSRRRLYATGLDGRLDAVELQSGRPLWSTGDAAKPIGLVNDNVIAQAEPAGAAGRLEIVGLDPLSGSRTAARTVPLPSGVLASTRPAPESTFVAEASPEDGDARVSWRFSKHPRQGIAPGTAPRIRQPRAATTMSATPEVNAGTFRLNLRSGAVTDGGRAPAPQTMAAEKPPLVRAPSNPGELRFASADGRASAVSQRVADDSVAEPYRLKVYDARTHQPLGDFNSRASAVRFFVDDGQVIYDSKPYVEASGEHQVEVPRRIVAVNLSTGKEVWSVPVRDDTYRGPYPP